MAAKVKVIKTQNEFNILSSEQTLGKKAGVICFFNGQDAAAWKARLQDLNDLAGDFFEEASFIGVDTRFFPAIVDQFKAGVNQAAVFRHVKGAPAADVQVVDLSVAAVRAAVKK